MISPINRDGLVFTQPGRLEELYFNTGVNQPLATSMMPTNVQLGLPQLYNATLNPVTYGESTEGLQPITLEERKNMFQSNLQAKQQNKGIKNLLKTAAGFMIPGANLIMGGGLQNLNQRIRSSDFGQATSLADYLDMQKYGGAQGRRDAAARNMAQARGLQKQIDAGQYNNDNSGITDRGRGQTPSRSTSTSKAASPRQSRQTKGAGGLHSY